VGRGSGRTDAGALAGGVLLGLGLVGELVRVAAGHLVAARREGRPRLVGVVARHLRAPSRALSPAPPGARGEGWVGVAPQRCEGSEERRRRWRWGRREVQTGFMAQVALRESLT
jgi:hypothetical protein